MKFFTASVFLFVVSSCSIIDPYDEIIDFGGNANFVLIWVSYNVKYIDDTPFDRWQKPSETFSKKTGDCEDMAMLAASGLIAAGEYDVRIICYSIKPGINHTIIKWNGKFIEPQTGFEVDIGNVFIFYDHDFYSALKRCI
jgi:hypothetical protein